MKTFVNPQGEILALCDLSQPSDTKYDGISNQRHVEKLTRRQMTGQVLPITTSYFFRPKYLKRPAMSANRSDSVSDDIRLNIFTMKQDFVSHVWKLLSSDPRFEQQICLVRSLYWVVVVVVVVVVFVKAAE